MKECLGYCGEEFAEDELFNDPKTPPMSLDPCLCSACCYAHCEEKIEELEMEIEDIKSIQADL